MTKYTSGVAIALAALSTISGFSPTATNHNHHHSNHRHHPGRSALTSDSRSSTATYAATVLDGQEIRGPITPLGNFVVVRTKETLMATGGGILLPDQSKERPTEGEVITAGPGKLHPHTGVRIDNPVSAGMSVLYGKFDGFPVTYNDDEMQIIRDDDVMLYYTGNRMTKENVTPCRDYVLVKLDESKMETSSGIVVAASVMKDDLPCVGTVFKVGEGRLGSLGEFTSSPVALGDRLKFRDYAGNEVQIDGEEYAVVRMVEILCFAEDS